MENSMAPGFPALERTMKNSLHSGFCPLSYVGLLTSRSPPRLVFFLARGFVLPHLYILLFRYNFLQPPPQPSMVLLVPK